VKARLLLRTPEADTHFKHAWQTLYDLNKTTASAIDLKAGQDVTITWSSDNKSEFALTQTGAQSYHEVVKTVTSKRKQTTLLWGSK
jgi:hypothetical protein